MVPRVTRWSLFLDEYDFNIEHRAGSQMRHVDALSRYPVTIVSEDDIILRLKKAQETDENINTLRKIVKEKPCNGYTMTRDLLYKFEKGYDLIVVPEAMQNEIIKRAHNQGHFGVQRTIEKLGQEYYISKVQEKVKKVIANCIACILVNRKAGKREGELHPLVKDDCPLYTYHVDFLGPLESTNKSYKHIFVVIDAFTKFAWLYPTRSTTTKDAVDKLEIQKRTFGNPSQLISDRGTAFTSADFKKYCEEEKINHFKITTGLPRANGQVERLNRVIIAVLSKLSINDPSKWYKHVDRVQQTINATYHRSIGTTPFEMLVGVKMKTKDEINLKRLVEEELAETFKDAREDLRKEAKKQIFKVQEENKRTYNLRRRKATLYKEGDLVAIKKTQFDVGSKLKPNFMGPYRIVKTKKNDTYDLIKDGDHEGPAKTTSCAEFMKPWLVDDDELVTAFEANVNQDGRDVGVNF